MERKFLEEVRPANFRSVGKFLQEGLRRRDYLYSPSTYDKEPAVRRLSIHLGSGPNEADGNII